MTGAEIRRRLRDLLGGDRSEEDAVLAAQLLAELDAERRAAVKRPRPAPVEDEAAKWARTLAAMGRGGGSMTRVIGGPSRPRTEHVSGLVRDSFRPWR